MWLTAYVFSKTKCCVRVPFLPPSALLVNNAVTKRATVRCGAATEYNVASSPSLLSSLVSSAFSGLRSISISLVVDFCIAALCLHRLSVSSCGRLLTGNIINIKGRFIVVCLFVRWLARWFALGSFVPPPFSDASLPIPSQLVVRDRVR